MKSLTIYATTDSGYLEGKDLNYELAFPGTPKTNSWSLYIGQRYFGYFYNYHGILKFDTSVIPDYAAIVSAQLRLAVYGCDVSEPFTVDLYKTTSLSSTTDQDYKDSTWQVFDTEKTGLLYGDINDLSWISKTDPTYYCLVTNRSADNIEPSGSEMIECYGTIDYATNRRPALIVDYLELLEGEELDHIYYFLEIDWKGTGLVDSWQDEASRITRFALDRGRDRVIGAPGSGFEMPDIGKAIFTLDNHDGRFDAWNASSPLYSYIQPGRRCNFSCHYNGTYYDLMTGYIADIRPEGYKDTATLVIEDGAGWLNSKSPDIPLLDVSDVADAINAILDNLNYPFGRLIDNAIDDLDYYWTSGATGLAEIHKLANSDLGRFCVEANGRARFRNRHNSESVDHTITEAQIGTNIYIPMPWDYSRSIVDVYTYPRITGTTDTTLWTLNDDPVINAGETMTLWGEYTYDNQAVPATGVYVAPSSDFSSTDLVVSAFSRDVKLELTNPTTDAQIITELIVKGTPIYSPDRIRIRKEASNVSTLPAAFIMDYEWLTSINTAESFAEVLLSYLNDAKQYPEIIIYHRPDIACPIDLEDRLRLLIDTWNIDETFFVHKISHESGASMQELITTVKLYPMLQDIGTDTFILDSETQGILDTNKLGF